MSKTNYLTRPLTEETVKTVCVEKTLENGKSVNGAWSRAQLGMLGVEWPPAKGWKAALIRQKLRLSYEQHDQFVAVRKVA